MYGTALKLSLCLPLKGSSHVYTHQDMSNWFVKRDVGNQASWQQNLQFGNNDLCNFYEKIVEYLLEVKFQRTDCWTSS